MAPRELDQFLAASDLEVVRSALEPYLLPVHQGDVSALWDALPTGTASVGSLAQQGLPGAFGRLSSAAGLVFAVLARFFLMITFLFYLLRDDWKLRRWFVRSVDHDEAVVSFLDTVDDDLEVIFVGNLAVVGIAAVFAAVSYYALNLLAPGGTVVGVPVLLALLIGIGTLIPAVGMKIVYVPYGIYLLGLALGTATPLWHPIVFFAVSFTIVDTIPDFFARSFLSARSGVHMGLVLLGYFLGTLAFGWYGLFLGPIVVVLLVHFADDVFLDLAGALLED
ncbi:AI-2E family transporter [Halovivax ruber]|uniref:AI-2E family transporter n=1 Tax=Halovivax ruber TaxID=387341 RepID=UPI00315CDCE7